MVSFWLLWLLQAYIYVVAVIMLMYMVRHMVFTSTRLHRKQRRFYHEILDSELPPVTVLVPMHNEEAVAHDILRALINSDYPKDLLEVIPIDDHSEDRTEQILHEYADQYSYIRPLHRRSGPRGKPSGLNDALEYASHEVVIVFDADYTPPADMIKQLAMAFVDPEVGAVMGRVVPENTKRGLLTRLLDLERAGGYQVDQQARYTRNLIPQYGGTVGAFRRSVVLSMGGFNPRILAEDTDLTFALFTRGWQVAYANRSECYEESPENWDVRFRQVRRWARGHTQAAFRHFLRTLSTRYLRFWQKVDGAMLLGVYAIPTLLATAILAHLVLFLSGRVAPFTLLIAALFCIANSYGNFAPFFEVGSATMLDGGRRRTWLLPYMAYVFIFNVWAVVSGLKDALLDVIREGTPQWEKTERYRQ